jgi:hypothetical protein
MLRSSAVLALTAASLAISACSGSRPVPRAALSGPNSPAVFRGEPPCAYRIVTRVEQFGSSDRLPYAAFSKRARNLGAHAVVGVYREDVTSGNLLRTVWTGYAVAFSDPSDTTCYRQS